MVKYRKIPVVIEAAQWFSMGDHASVIHHNDCFPSEKDNDCDLCGVPYGYHGIVPTLEDGIKAGHVVCPGDWIITGVKGEHYACKPDIFKLTYEPVVQHI